MSRLFEIEFLKNKSKDLMNLFSNPNRCRDYDDFLLDYSMKKWDTPVVENGRLKHFDANSVMQTYEMSIQLDKRIVEQVVEQSALRKTFKNFPSEKIFYEFTGVDPTAKTYEPQLFEASGLDNTAETATLPFAMDPNEISIIKAKMEILRRPIKVEQRGFYLSLLDLEAAASRSVPIQQMFTNRAIRDLGIAEQTFAFKSDYGSASYEMGLFNNTSISTAISASVNWSTATSGRAILDDIVKVISAIESLTKGIFDYAPICILCSVKNVNLLLRPFSDLVTSNIVNQLTENQWRIAGIPMMPDTFMYVWFNDPMHIELSTAEIAKALPQGYIANKTSYFFPFRNVTAGLTVKIPEAIYKVSGIG